MDKEFIKQAREFRKKTKEQLKRVEKERSKYCIVDGNKKTYKPKFFSLDEKVCKLSDTIEALDELIG